MIFTIDPSIRIFNSSFEDQTNNSTSSVGWTLFPTFAVPGNSVLSTFPGYLTGVQTPPDGNGYLVLQGTGSARQKLNGFTIGQQYTMSIWAIQRNATFNQFNVHIDTTILSSSIIAPSSTEWTQYLFSFTASQVDHAISFSGVAAGGGDRTVCIDSVQFLMPVEQIFLTKTTKSAPLVGWNAIGKKGLLESGSVVGHVQGISLGGPTSVTGEDTYGTRNYLMGWGKNPSEGSATAPCLEFLHPGMWRFKWVVKPGQRRISIRTKQVKNFSGQRPSMTIKKNTNVGINSDIVTYAPTGSDWVTIGPVIFTATGTDMVWVELRNNLHMSEYPVSQSKALFDHIIVT